MQAPNILGCQQRPKKPSCLRRRRSHRQIYKRCLPRAVSSAVRGGIAKPAIGRVGCSIEEESRRAGWPLPIRHLVEAHLKTMRMVHRLLPVRRTTIEVAQFDLQKIHHPEIEGRAYQEGPQLGFWNVREFVLYRDQHCCQWCLGKSKDKILNVHHIISRKTGGDRPDNLITLCKTCHRSYSSHAPGRQAPSKERRISEMRLR